MRMQINANVNESERNYLNSLLERYSLRGYEFTDTYANNVLIREFRIVYVQFLLFCL